MADDRSSKSPPLDEDFYSQLLGRSTVAVIATDTDFRVVFCNRAAGRLLNQSVRALSGKSIYDLVPEQRRKLLERLLRRTIDRNHTTQLEVRITDENGNRRDLAFLISPICDEGGPPRGVAAWILDETQRTQLVERLAQAEKLASLGTLAGGVAHHFNNIFGGVATFVDFALTSGDAVAMKRALQMTAEAAARAGKITQSLLSFAKKAPHRTDLADLTEVVLTFSHLVEKPLAEHNIELKLDLKPVPVVEVESSRMHQGLSNLLTNSEEAMPDGGKVNLSVDRVGNDVVLTFGDTGRGITAKDISQVFEPFFTTKGLHHGGERANIGLGLSVVHGIILEMGGKIETESQEGKGTTFRISFPIPGN